MNAFRLFNVLVCNARVVPSLLLVLLPTCLLAQAGPSVRAGTELEAGRYLVVVGGCNDCHTDGWAQTGGKVAETDWLKGSAMGWRGPWGTTYASNLRLLVDEMSEDAWVAMLKTRTDRPPMPWMNVNQLGEEDARAMYRFIDSLGAAGDRMPLASDPAQEPSTPYLLMEPVMPRPLEASEPGDSRQRSP